MLSTLRLGNRRPGFKVGLLGGSFNPAHSGHIHISLVALKRLRLDEVWWLVSPQNPLKPTGITRDLSQRVAVARALVRHPRIKVLDAESELGTQFTVDTLRALKTNLPHMTFIWLMGADNFIELPRWKNWTAIMSLAPVAVIARPGYHLKAGLSQAACRYRMNRLKSGNASLLTQHQPPAWTLIIDKLSSLSSTLLRPTRKR